MNIYLVSIAAAGARDRPGPETQLIEEYRERTQRFAPCAVQSYRSSEEMLEAAERARKRYALRLVLLDSSGERLSSEQFAEHVRRYRDGGIRELWAAIGPADGWSRNTLAKADLLLSLGAMTLPHRLAQVVVAEQIYRALTILAGHPYHSGH